MTEQLFAHHGYGPDQIAAYRDSFQSAEPFRHIAIDDFLTLSPDAVLPQYPAPDWPGWTVFNDQYQFNKRFCGDIDKIPPLFQAMIHELSSPAFLAFMEEVTGVKGLIPDPYLTGGGLHCSGKGGVLAPHADFHHYQRLELFRRINVLVYFNTDWTDADGGSLELFRKGQKVPDKRILPEFGRMVMFLTDNKSIHGFSQPIVEEGRYRRSLALYYYTSEETRDFSGDSDTLWQTHGKQDAVGLARLAAYKILLRASGLVSRMAHAANPNLAKRPTRGD